MLPRITSRGRNSQIGIGIKYDLEYKDIVIEFGKWYIAIGIK